MSIKFGNEIHLDASTAEQQSHPQLLGLADGRFVASWTEYTASIGSQIHIQMFDADGGRHGTEYVVTPVFQSGNDQQLNATSDGGFALAWSEYGNGTLNVVAQRFDSDGAAAGSKIVISASSTNGQYYPDIAAGPDGSFVATWQRYAVGSSDADTMVQVVNADGSPSGSAFGLAAPGQAKLYNPKIANLADGRFVVVWEHEQVDIHGMILNADGTKAGPDFAINTITAGVQMSPSVTALADGGFAVVWQDLSNNSNWDSRGQIFDASGARSGSEFLINTTTGGSQYQPVVAQIADGRLVAAWTDDNFSGADGSQNIRAQMFDLHGNRSGDELVVDVLSTGTRGYPSIAALSDGRFIVGWDFDRTDGQTAGAGEYARILDPREGPVIVSNGGGDSAPVSVSENTTTVTTVVATGATALSYSIAGGADAAHFQIDAVTGALSFKTAPDFEAPADAGTDNSYVVTVRASDGVQSDDQTITVSVTNVNDAPAITSNGGGDTATVSVGENTSAVTTVAATGAALSYLIAGGADAAHFQIDAATGELSFTAAPDFEAPADGGADNSYVVTVRASDGVQSDDQTITVSVTNVNDAPAITSNGGGDTATVSVGENTSAVTTVAATGANGAALSYSIAGGVDAAHFQIDAATGALSFTAAPDFEAPADGGADNSYVVTVRASDGTQNDDQTITVNVIDANEAPAIASNGGGATASVEVPENSTAVTTVTASDPDAGSTVHFSIVGGADAAFFHIDDATGALAFNQAPDFELLADADHDNSYAVVVRASDGSLSDEQTITVKVTNQNEAPTINAKGGGAVDVPENTTAVTTIQATDPDQSDTIHFSIAGGADASVFQIDEVTGALSFIAAPNFEAPADADHDNHYEVTVRATDGSLFDQQALTVNVTNANEAPVITSGSGDSASLSVAENTSAATTVTATDPDSAALTYSIAGGADAARLQIDAATGALSFKIAPDFEAPADADHDNHYVVTVRASDGSLSDDQTITIAVNNINEAPAITAPVAAAVAVSENTTAVTTVTASDPDAGSTIHFSIAGGADASLFQIDDATGALSFVAAPNFEAPADADHDNHYEVTVRASDGSLFNEQTFTVNVTNANDAPAINSDGGDDSATASVSENTLSVTTVTAGAPGNPYLFYSIVGGADAARFQINAATGALSFVAAPDFEAPSDVDHNNSYDVVVRASDGILFDEQSIAVTVSDQSEPISPVVKFGEEFLVNTTTFGHQMQPAIAAFSNGRFVATWADFAILGDPKIRVQVFNADGTKSSDELSVPTTATHNQSEPAITTLADGRFVVAWNDYSATTPSDIHGQIFNLDGTKSGFEFVINTTTAQNQSQPTLATLADGRFIAAWTDNAGSGDDHDGFGIRAQIFDADGMKSGSEFQANTITAGHQWDPAITARPDGGFIVGWTDTGGSYGDPSDAVEAQIFSAGPHGAVLVNTTTTGSQSVPAIASLTDGRFVATWIDTSHTGGDTEQTAVRAKVFSADGTTSGPELLVNTTTASGQSEATVTALLDGRFVVAWTDSSTTGTDISGDAVRAQIFNSNGEKFGGEFLVNTTTYLSQFAPTITALADGRFTIAWIDGSLTPDDTSGYAIRAQIFDPRLVAVNLPGTPQPDDLIGTPFNDTLHGATGKDRLEGGAGNDIIDGGEGIDTAVFSGLSSAYTITPTSTGYQVSGPDGVDTLTGIEFATFDDMTIPLGSGSPQMTGGATATVRLAENSTAVTTVTATDPNGDPLTYSLAGGEDAALFQIDPVTGALAFIAPPDFENPADHDRNNSYVVTVRASDGNLAAEQTITVNIADQVSPPAITSNGGGDKGTISVTEHTTEVTTVVATDPDGDPLSYSIVGGSDAGRFQIDPSTGALSFVAAPDFAAPADSDHDNSYIVQVQASDGGSTDTQTITVNVTEVSAEPVMVWLTGTAGDDTFAALPGNERIDALGGNDTVSFDFRLVDATVTWAGNQVIIDGPNSHTVLTGFETYVFTDGTVNNKDGDGLVDDLFYYSQNHDVWNAHADADQHYHQYGWREGRDPDAFFSTALYLAINPDMKASGIDPLIQFDQSGWKEGRVPSFAFDGAKYLAANPDVAAAHVDPLEHFLSHGAQEGRQPFALTELLKPNGFDYVYYLQHNPDVAAAHVDPYRHFEDFGWKEGRNPNALFDTKGYLAAYSDVAAANINPLDHYAQFGWLEGRDPSVNFDTTSYLAYPDIAAAHVDPLVHFLANGIHEGRSAFGDGSWG